MCANEKAQVKEPIFLVVIIGMGEVACRCGDGGYISPHSCFGLLATLESRLVVSTR